MSTTASEHRETYEDRADRHLRALLRWLREHLASRLRITYRGVTRTAPEVLAQTLGPLIERLLVHLQQNPAFSDWPLWSILASAENYREFVRDAWQRKVDHFLREDRAEYQVLPFGEDEALQDALPRLVRTGTVVPIAVDQSIHLPAWASPAVAVDAQAVRRRQLDEDLWTIDEDLWPDELRWVTAVSRQALISGLRPARFADTLTTTRHEGRRWSEYWQAREKVTADRFFYAILSDRLDAPFPSAVGSQRTIASCLVSNVIDAMLHGATQGSADMQASLRLWLADGTYRQPWRAHDRRDGGAVDYHREWVGLPVG